MLITIISFILVTNALTLRKDKSIFYSRSAILGLLCASFICYNNLFVLNLEKGIGLYGGIFNITSLTQSFNIFIILISACILVYNSFYHRSLISSNTSRIRDILFRKKNYTMVSLQDTKLEIYRIIEYPLIILFIICGAVFLISSGDLISLFISIELQSYGLYILSTLHRDSEQATWGGLTYFLLGGLSSCFILLGSALLYINSGTTSLDGLYIITAISDITSYNTYDTYYINISLIILAVGLLFKISAAPFHFWSPDVYDAIPTAVTTYVAIIAKLSIFIVLLELVYYINNDLAMFSWKNCLLISSILSLIIGSLLGLTQYRIKRVYAYSTISHVGFILLALSVDNTESIQAYIFYIISYTITNLNAFVILITIGYTMYLYVYNETNLHNINNINNLNPNLSKQSNNNLLTDSNHTSQAYHIGLNSETKSSTMALNHIFDTKLLSYNKTYSNINHNNGLKDINNSPIQLVNQLKGYFYINPYLCLSLTITLFSFIGVPPLIGFFAKQMVLSAALDNGLVFITLLAIITSVIGAGYYLNIVKQMFFFKSDYVLNPYLNSWANNYNIFGTYYCEFKSIFSGLIQTNHKANNVISDKSYQPEHTIYNLKHITINSALSVIISVLTLLLLSFIFIPNESFNIAKILTLLIFN